MESGVKIKEVSKDFGTTKVLQKIDLEIEVGQLVCLLGTSGCGKTTLLRIIAGLETPTSGSIFFDNQLQNSLPAEKRQIAMVFQKALLFPNMTVAENVGFSLYVNNTPRKEINLRVKEILEIVQLSDFEERHPNELSGGQEQRVSLARALLKKPKVLLLDEPLSALDANLRIEMRNLIRKIHDKSIMTTLFVTHDQEEASAISDKIAFMDSGQICQFAPVAEFFSSPSSEKVAKFFGCLNLFRGNISKAGFETNFHLFDLLKKFPIGPAWAAIRQEDLQLEKKDSKNAITATIESIQFVSSKILVTCKLITGKEGFFETIYVETNRFLDFLVGERVFITYSSDAIHLMTAAHGEFDIK